MIALMLGWRDGAGDKEGRDKGQRKQRDRRDGKGQGRRTEGKKKELEVRQEAEEGRCTIYCRGSGGQSLVGLRRTEWSNRMEKHRQAGRKTKKADGE